MNPVVLIGGAAALLLLAGGKKKKSGRGEPPMIGGGEPTPPGEPPRPKSPATKILTSHSGKPEIGEPWARCDPPPGSPQGTYAAISQDGTECMVFWKPETEAVIMQLLKNEFDQLSKDQQESICDQDCVPDVFAMEPELFCQWTHDPERDALIKRVLLQAYPMIPGNQFPPPKPDKLGRINAPYFVKVVWKKVEYMFGREFCGFNPVST